MNLSHAMALAAGSLPVEKDQLRTIARTLESEKRSRPKRLRPATATGNVRQEMPWRQESTMALQASRRLLARTIDMLT